MAVAAVGLVGAAVGWGAFTVGVIGATTLATAVQVGWIAGTLLGTLLFAKENIIEQSGPRLGDLDTQTAKWGTSIPRLFGSFKLAGNVIWSLPLHETKHVDESGEGKGQGGTKTSSTWYSYAGSWAVAFCEGTIEGVKRIWFDSVLVYDGVNYHGGLDYDNYNVHKGTGNQSVDWFIQSKDEDTPAYRNVVYIVFRKIELENYGNRVPNVSVELVEKGDFPPPRFIDKTIFKNTPDLDMNKYSATLYAGKGGVAYVHPGLKMSLQSHGKAVISSQYPPREDDDDLGEFTEYRYFSLKGQEKFPLPEKPEILEPEYNIESARVYYTERFEYVLLVGGGGYQYLVIPPVENSPDNDARVIIDDENIHDIAPYDDGLLQLNTNDEIIILDSNFIEVRTVSLNWNDKKPKMTTNVFERTRITNVDNGVVYIAASSSEFIDSIGWLFYKTNLDDGNVEYLGEFRDTDNINFTNSSQATSIIIKNAIANISQASVTYSYYYVDLSPFDKLSVPISSVCSDVLLRAGLKEDEFDVSDGVELISGYVITKSMSARAALLPITTAYQYDMTEIDSVIRLLKRGYDSLVQINMSEESVGDVSVKRTQEVELSKQINVQYANESNDYQYGLQVAQRIDRNADGIRNYQFNMALTDDKAKQIAEIILFNEWNETLTFEFMLSRDYEYLKPADVITLLYDGSNYNVRVTDIAFNTDSSISIKSTIENGEVYESFAEGSNTNNSGLTQDKVDLIGITYMYVLDIPTLDSQLDFPSLYIAVRGAFSGWKGCEVHKSRDNVDYSRVIGGLQNTIMGYTLTELQTGVSHIFDRASVVTVIVIDESLYSVTKEILLSGENYVLIGNEILQYQDAIDNGDNTFTLRNFLRGRRGTEWAITTHELNDRFVFLDTTLLADIDVTISSKTYYKATTLGHFVEDSSPIEITPELVSKMPFSVEYIRCQSEDNDDKTIQWMRRSREVSGYMRTLSLFESFERYQIDIYDDAHVDVVATKTIDEAQEYFYPASNQTSDGITPGLPMKIMIYQMSDFVGRGYGKEAIL